MHLDTALIGRWDSSPFDVGVMEASELEFREDGRGSGTVVNALSEDTEEFSWHCPEPGVVEIREDSGGTERFQYTVGAATPPYGPAPVPAVTFEPHLLFTQQYARVHPSSA
ncbi:hypothetical protein ACWCV9_16810 [Streptomyces sp. NPDC001606]